MEFRRTALSLCTIDARRRGRSPFSGFCETEQAENSLSPATQRAYSAFVGSAVQDAVADAAPFEFEVRGAGGFPKPSRPRTVWLGIAQGRQEMIDLNKRIEPPLEKLGYRREARRFQPHLTIGRDRRGGPAVAELGTMIGEHAEVELGLTKVAEVVFFSSQLDRSGPTYEPLARAPLGGP